MRQVWQACKSSRSYPSRKDYDDERYYQALCFRCNNLKGAYEDKEAIKEYLQDKEFLKNQGEGVKKIENK